jgi:hypothetical protein
MPLHPRKKRESKPVPMVAKPKVFKETLSGGAAKKSSIETATQAAEKQKLKEQQRSSRDNDSPSAMPPPPSRDAPAPPPLPPLPEEKTNDDEGDKGEDEAASEASSDDFYLAPSAKDVLMKSSGLNGSAPFAYDTELDDGVNADKKQKFRRAQGGLKGAARGVYGSRLEYNPPWRKSYLIVIDIISCTFHV